MVLDNQNITKNQISPFVLWGQNERIITLSIQLREVESPNVDLEENKICFQAFGVGEQGANDYTFEFDFFDSIDAKASAFKVNENCIDILIKKRKQEIWPRLTLSRLRRAWLKVNFEKSYWNEIDDEISFEKTKNEELEFYQRNDLSQLGSELYNKDREKLLKNDLINRPISRVEFYRKFYLTLYNLVQLYGAIYLLTVLIVRYDQSSGQLNACRDVQSTINFLCYVKLFEILHQMFGFVFNKDRTVWYNVLNRIFIFCILINYESRLIIKPVVFFLVILYAIMDIANYAFFISRTLNLEISMLKYLKCTIWIPVYPLIFLCEAVILLRSIPYYDETKRLTLQLPNQYNISFSFLIFLRTYLFIFFAPLMCFTMNNFYKHRLQQFASAAKERQIKKII